MDVNRDRPRLVVDDSVCECGSILSWQVSQWRHKRVNGSLYITTHEPTPKVSDK